MIFTGFFNTSPSGKFSFIKSRKKGYISSRCYFLNGSLIIVYFILQITCPLKKCPDLNVKNDDCHNYLCGRKKLFVFSLVMRNIYLQMLVCSFLIFLVLLFTNKVTPTTYYGNNALYSLLSTIKKHLCCYTVHLKFKMKHIWSELRSRLENR